MGGPSGGTAGPAPLLSNHKVLFFDNKAAPNGVEIDPAEATHALRRDAGVAP